MAMLLTLLFTLVIFSHAEEDWACREVGTIRSGNTFQSCGVGLGGVEDEARKAALENANTEFRTICEQSSDCRGRRTVVNPKRMTCQKQSDGQFLCRRMMEFTVLSDSAPMETAGSREHGVICKGMTKETLLARFGKPTHILKIDDRFMAFRYAGAPFCNPDCVVGLDNDKVYKFEGFKPSATDDLRSKSFWEKMGLTDHCGK